MGVTRARSLAKTARTDYRGGVNIIGLQLDIVWENKPANFRKTRELLEQASPRPGSLVVLPEMFATGFSMNAMAIAEPYQSETETFLASLGRDFGVYVLGGAAMRDKTGKARNKALLFAPNGEMKGFYAKMRPFTLGGEPEHYSAGERPACFNIEGIHVAPFICYDLRFPELFRQSAALNQPELFVVIANWPGKRIAHWMRLLQARAIENQAYVVGVNRVGTDPYYTYSGRSLIVDFNGDILADGGNTESTISSELDFNTLRQYRQGLPFLADLRL